MSKNIAEQCTERALAYNEENAGAFIMTGKGMIIFQPFLTEKKLSDKDKSAKAALVASEADKAKIDDIGNFAVTIALDKDDPATKDVLNRFEEYRKDKLKNKKSVKVPFKDGDEYFDTRFDDAEDKEGQEKIEKYYGHLKGKVFFNALSHFTLKDAVIDGDCKPVDLKSINSKAECSFIFSLYDSNYSNIRRINAGLRNIQVYTLGEVFSGGSGAAASSSFGSMGSGLTPKTETAESFGSVKEQTKEEFEAAQTKKEFEEGLPVASDGDMFGGSTDPLS